MSKQGGPFKLREHLPYVIVAVLPFLLNDAIDFIVHSQRSWVFWNYIFTYPLPLVAVALWLHRYGPSPKNIGLSPISLRKLLSESLIASLLGILVTTVVFHYLKIVFPSGSLASRPVLNEEILFIVDLTLGLAFVAATEEVVFRGFLLTIFDRFFGSQDIATTSAAILFALIHWAQGPAVIVTTFFVAIAFTWRRRASDNLYPLIFAHYLINLFSNFMNTTNGL